MPFGLQTSRFQTFKVIKANTLSRRSRGTVCTLYSTDKLLVLEKGEQSSGKGIPCADDQYLF
jgi:hypothetical protein